MNKLEGIILSIFGRRVGAMTCNEKILLCLPFLAYAIIIVELHWKEVRAMVWAVILYLLIILTGGWLSKSGRPLKVLPSAVHKVLAVGLLVLTAVQLFGGDGFGALPVVRQVTGIVGLAALISLFATGAVLSGKEGKKPLVALHVIGTVLVLVCAAGWEIAGTMKVTLPDQASGINYQVSDSSVCTRSIRDEKTSNRNDTNLYTADRKQLRKLDLINYRKSFGSIDNAQTAAQAADYVHDELYGAPSGDYVVRYNENAKAWIVYDKLPENAVGGCGVFAITKEAGEVIMGYHEK